jgi:L-glutamine-phosphate cytidylyltransferase
MELIILASGKGSRLKGFNKNPKCFTKVFNKTLIDHLSKNFKKFNKIFLVVGYKSFLFNKKKYKNLKIIKNKDYKFTNMVQSLYCVKNYIKEDVVITYSDILFNSEIMDKLIAKRKSSLALKSNWLLTWKKRMSRKKIILDAENIEFSKNKILSIGGKIVSLPKAQYMGLIKLKKKDYSLSMNFYKKLNNTKIDMTTFLNLLIKNKIIDLGYFLTKKFWYEIDTPKDLSSLKKLRVNF